MPWHPIVPKPSFSGEAVTGSVALSFLPICSCAEEPTLSTVVLQYSSRLRYGSWLFALDLFSKDWMI